MNEWMRKGWMNKCMYQVTKWNIYWIRKGWINEYTRLQNEYLLDEKRMTEWMYLVAKWISIGWENWINEGIYLVANWISIEWEKNEWRNVPGCKMNIYWMRKVCNISSFWVINLKQSFNENLSGLGQILL